MNVYVCRKIEENLMIDGNLDKPEWGKAVAVQLVDTVTGAKPKQTTTVKLIWSNDFLYAGFCCKDDYICATMTEYNDKLYEEDVVELFIDDDLDHKTYIEIEINPLNAVLHYGIQNDSQKRFLQFARVEKKVLSAVAHHDKLGIYTVELAIPFSEFITAKHNPPIKGERWLFNLYRIDRGKNGADEYSAWSPTGKLNFHIPEKFGELVFE